MKRKFASLGVSAVVTVSAFAALAVSANQAGAQNAAATPAPAPAAGQADPGKAVFESVCSNCHELAIATDQRKSRADWADTVDKMIGHGAPLTSEQAAQVVDYLAKHYGPDSK